MNTELMADHEKRAKEMNERMLDGRIKAFIANYRPKEGWEQTDFEGDLLMLVRQIYADAQAPLLKQITDMCAVMPVQFEKEKQTGKITSTTVDRALKAWFASPPSETDQGLERSMRAALEAAFR